MLDPSTLGFFLAATVALNLTPGPDMLYVMGRSIGQGQRAGVVSALGVGAGIVVHTLAATLGLAALLMSSALAYDAVRYAGALYLAYLGIRTLFRPSEAGAHPASAARSTRVFQQGMLTNVLNPKVALFFLAFLPQFVRPERGNPALQILMLGILFNLSGTFWNLNVALLAGKLGDLLRRRPAIARAQRWFTGAVFLGLGFRLALGERR